MPPSGWRAYRPLRRSPSAGTAAPTANRPAAAFIGRTPRLSGKPPLPGHPRPPRTAPQLVRTGEGGGGRGAGRHAPSPAPSRQNRSRLGVARVPGLVRGLPRAGGRWPLCPGAPSRCGTPMRGGSRPRIRHPAQADRWELAGGRRRYAPAPCPCRRRRPAPARRPPLRPRTQVSGAHEERDDVASTPAAHLPGEIGPASWEPRVKSS